MQLISEGEASQRVTSQSLVVLSDLEERTLLEGVEVVPATFTPNGDGVNDVAQVRLSIFHLQREKVLGVEVFDLAGQRVRNLSVVRQRPSGEHVVEWDGRDREGRLVVPGVYVVKMQVETDADDRQNETLRLVHVVY